ncbi:MULTISPECIES: hypothetical protein [unclassified Bradyrhizobium]|uniref:hypothetical protein n=1 Tax=unclassified Bradyrhizobium TaxID=2631580 RepID=UPI0024790198|nr:MULTISPECIES: hypothetical protein [unclassified Bradyrhizobium]WGR74341.1 hypothetical protein MTX24_16585 [Bradyrhizobium sp. ISRA426]WGR79176.1 hypothetical protein MTX21_01700 [Bradyrhizobium sp. ISRA430]WGR90597.1 hypothetical protein MTX25_39845 [Bradyrhizobium sp. ISRA432]
MIRLALALLLVMFAAPAFSQQVPPYVYPLTIGTSSTSILPANPSRKKLIFHNPNDTAKVAVCPIGPSRTGSPSTNVVAAINGAGCITILPYDRVEISSGLPTSPQSMPSAWVGVASAGGSALTIMEFE